MAKTTELSKPSIRSSKSDRAGKPSAEATANEAERLISEGLHIRWASLQRRFKLQGPMVFDGTAKEVPPVRSFADLVPAYLRKQPADAWQVTPGGFELVLAWPDAAAVAKLINARRDELGVYHCTRADVGWTFIVEF